MIIIRDNKVYNIDIGTILCWSDTTAELRVHGDRVNEAMEKENARVQDGRITSEEYHEFLETELVDISMEGYKATILDLIELLGQSEFDRLFLMEGKTLEDAEMSLIHESRDINAGFDMDRMILIECKPCAELRAQQEQVELPTEGAISNIEVIPVEPENVKDEASFKDFMTRVRNNLIPNNTTKPQ